MRIEEHPEAGIMFFADDKFEQGLLGQLLMNVRTHDYGAVDMLQGKITFPAYDFKRGHLGLYTELDPTCIAEMLGFKKRKPMPVPPPEPEHEFINSVEMVICN